MKQSQFFCSTGENWDNRIFVSVKFMTKKYGLCLRLNQQQLSGSLPKANIASCHVN